MKRVRGVGGVVGGDCPEVGDFKRRMGWEVREGKTKTTRIRYQYRTINQ